MKGVCKICGCTDHNPKGLYKEILFAYIRDNYNVEIIEEGGKA